MDGEGCDPLGVCQVCESEMGDGTGKGGGGWCIADASGTVLVCICIHSYLHTFTHSGHGKNTSILGVPRRFRPGKERTASNSEPWRKEPKPATGEGAGACEGEGTAQPYIHPLDQAPGTRHQARNASGQWTAVGRELH